MIGTLITILVVLCIIAILIWAINSIPVPAPFAWVRVVVIALVAIGVLLWILQSFGGPGLSFRYR